MTSATCAAPRHPSTLNVSGETALHDEIRRMLYDPRVLPHGSGERIAARLNVPAWSVYLQLRGERPLQLRTFLAAIPEMSREARLHVVRTALGRYGLATALLGSEEPTALDRSDPASLVEDAARTATAATSLTLAASKAARDGQLDTGECRTLAKQAEDVLVQAERIAEQLAPWGSVVSIRQRELF